MERPGKTRAFLRVNGRTRRGFAAQLRNCIRHCPRECLTPPGTSLPTQSNATWFPSLHLQTFYHTFPGLSIGLERKGAISHSPPAANAPMALPHAAAGRL